MLAAAWQSSCWPWIRGRRIHARSCLISVAGSSRLRRKSSDRFFRSPGGLSTTLRKSGRLSSSAHSQRCGKPVIADDIENEKRFDVPQFLRDHGIKSLINVIIQGKGEAFGVLEVDSAERIGGEHHEIPF